MTEKRSLINGYYLLEQDLKEIISFVEPTRKNFKTYSHRMYSLFIRACIEFEASCKMILIENQYKFDKNKNPNMLTYFYIHDFSNYKSINTCLVRLHMSEEINLKPLIDWKNDKGPFWYQAYNDVKHSRVLNFSKANLRNVLNAVAAVFILLYAKYGRDALNQYHGTEIWLTDDDGFIYKENSLFKIKPKKMKI